MPRPPHAELHLHLEGTLEPELVLALAERNGIDLPYADADDLRARYDFTDLQSFLDLYYANMAVLRTEEDFAAMTRAYLARAAAAGVRHAEVMLDPQAHLVRGVPLATAVGGVAGVLATSEEEFGITTALVAAFLRDRPAAEAMEVLEELLATGAPIVGVGLDSAEVGHPAGLFQEVFARAEAAGLRRIAHAGEEGPAQSVRDALDLLHAERIDHGIRAVEDPELVARLVAEQVPLTVCPLSNVRLRAVPSLAEHPLHRMLRAGLVVSVHSDDPAYFGGWSDDAYDAVAAELGLTAEELAELATNSFRSAFLPDDVRDAYVAEVEEWLVEQQD